jgi:hypothetical protein
MGGVALLTFPHERRIQLASMAAIVAIVAVLAFLLLSLVRAPAAW